MSLQHHACAHGRRNNEQQPVPSFAKSGYSKRKWQGSLPFEGGSCLQADSATHVTYTSRLLGPCPAQSG